MSDNDFPTRAAELPGGRYRLIERIGRGGTSEVWRAHDELLERDVAVKILSPTVDERFWPAIRGEARAAGGLHNARVAHVYDYGEVECADGVTSPYLVMELVEGRSLARRLTEEGPLAWPEAAEISAQIAEALAAAHARGLVHRDVKPDNVLLTAEGVKVIDFGISAVVGSPDVDDDGHLVGTAAYLAPERLVNVPVGAAADVYALGVLLYRTLTGHLPWDANGRTELLSAHLAIEPAPLPRINGLPAELATICAACLDKDPNARPSASEFAYRIGALAAVARAEAPLADDVEKSLPRRRNILVAAVAGAALALATGAWAWDSAGTGDEASGRAAAAAAAAPAACAATFAVDKDWGSGFSATLTVTNDSPTIVNDWRVSFQFAGDQQLTSSASGSPTVSQGIMAAVTRQDGPSVIATAATPGQVMVPNSRVVVPIRASYSGVNAIPTAVNLNSSGCRTVVTGAAYRPQPTAPKPASQHNSGQQPNQQSTGQPNSGEQDGQGSGDGGDGHRHGDHARHGDHGGDGS